MTSRSPSTRAILAGALAAAVLGGYLVVWARLGHAEAAGSDFSSSYVAAQTWRAGDAGRLYDQAAETARHQPLLPGYRIDLPFITPPTTALLAAPFTAAGIDTAFRLEALLELALVAAAVAIALRAAPRTPSLPRGARLAAGLAATAGLGTCVVLWQGQWDGLCALALAAAYAAWRSDRQALAGFALAAGFGATKPHLTIGLGLFLLAMRRPAAIAGAAAGIAAVAADGQPVGGPHAWADWVGSLGTSSVHSPLASLLGLTGLAGSWLGDTTAAHLLAAAGSALAVAACALLGDRVRRRPQLLEEALAGAAVLSLVAAPHLLLHDLAVLAPAAAWMLARGLREGGLGPVAAAWLALNAVAVLDMGNAAPAPPGRLVPIALVALGALAVSATAPPGRSRAAYSGSGSGVGGVVDQS